MRLHIGFLVYQCLYGGMASAMHFCQVLLKHFPFTSALMDTDSP